MLSIFPIMFLSLLAHAILRIIAGIVLFFEGTRHYRHARSEGGKLLFLISAVEILCGVLLMTGFATQLAALAILLFACLVIALHKRLGTIAQPYSFYVLYVGISLSLFITGAGAFAFDLPF